jgi:hypothetical protein
MSRIALALCVVLALAAVSQAAFYRSERDSSNDVVPGVNPKADGRRIPNQIITKQVNGKRFRSHQSACKSLENLSEEDQAVCAQMADVQAMRLQKHERIQKKLNSMLKAGPTPTVKPTHPPPATGYMINAQWDGMTFPSVQWGLDITRQKTQFSFNSSDLEKQLVNLIPIRPGNASSPTYTTYNPLTRNYYLITGNDEYSAFMWGASISSDTWSAKSLTPQVKFSFPQGGDILVGLEVVQLDGAEMVLVFYNDGTVAQVDPSSGTMKPYSSTVNPNTRQVNCVTYRPDTRDIFMLTQNQLGDPQYGILTFNFATRQSSEVLMQVPQYFDPTQEDGFEMVWMPTVQTMLVFFTGPFDQIMYYNPFTGAATLVVFNMADYQGSMGHLEFTVSTFLEDLDTTANAAIDLVGQQVYFQCSDVDPSSGEVTTALCNHPVPLSTDMSQWSYVNVEVEPMTYGYAAAEFVQVEN